MSHPRMGENLFLDKYLHTNARIQDVRIKDFAVKSDYSHLYSV